MIVEQALYGEIRGGHGLRMASATTPIISELTSRLDLPDTAPPGVDWSPFVSGFPHGEYYILARTFADPTATRPGMVLSHALIAPLAEIIELSDLRPLFSLLISEPKLPAALTTCELQTSGETPTPALELVPLAEALVTRGTGPVVRIGLHGFDELVFSLWAHLWPEIRAQFAFRLSFGPQDIVDTLKPSLICTPTPLASRWTRHRIVGTTNSATSLASGIICGGAEAASILAFAQQIGAIIRHFTDLPLLQHAYEIDSNPKARFEECVSVLRILERLSPNPIRGITSKTLLIQRLESRLLDASVQEILLLRNLSTTGLSEAPRIWASLKAWASVNPFTQHEDLDMLSALGDALSPSAAVEPWRLAVLNGILSASSALSEGFANAFWRWADLRPAVLTALMNQQPQEGGLENRLTGAVPHAVSFDTGNVVMAIANSRRWLQLHGVAASACLAPREAVARQLSIDMASPNLDGIRASLRCTSPTESIEIALALADPRVLRVAAERVAVEPALLGGLSFTTSSAQDLWCYALSINAEAWQGPLDPQSAFFTLIRNLLDGEEANMDLINTLSLSPLADLGTFAHCTEAWTGLPNPARTNCLRATATGWLKRVLTGDVIAPDRELEKAILSANDLEDTLQRTATSVSQVLRVIQLLPNLSESRCLRWLDEPTLLRQSLIFTDAQALGHLILRRSWQGVADRLVQLARQGRTDVKPALSECPNMISLLWRLLLGLSQISATEKWRVLEELAVSLYPTGPDQAALWDRAGGQDADLKSFGSGRTRWRDAIDELRRGRGPSVRTLLEEMRQEYPANDQLQALLASELF